jgi:hypothetical protein
MLVVFGSPISSVQDSLDAFTRHGDRMRGTYRAHYRFDVQSESPYTAPRLERPDCLAGSAPDAVFPWEQIYLSAAMCAGSDYPMFAAHFGIPIDSVDLVIEGVFDPRGEFDDTSGFHAPADAHHCYLSLHVRTTIVSTAPRATLEALHRRVISRNMVLGALRGIPTTSELTTSVPSRVEPFAAAASEG